MIAENVHILNFLFFNQFYQPHFRFIEKNHPSTANGASYLRFYRHNITLLAQRPQRLIQVIDRIADMVRRRTIFFYRLHNRRLRIGRFQQFHTRHALMCQKTDIDTLNGIEYGFSTSITQTLISGRRLLNITTRHADMMKFNRKIHLNIPLYPISDSRKTSCGPCPMKDPHRSRT